MKIEIIKQKVKEDDYFFSKHGDDEKKNDNLSILEIEETIANGAILENYDNDLRGSSCLIVGFTNNGKPIHVVCGTRDNILVIITVYIPTPPKFITPYERG